MPRLLVFVSHASADLPTAQEVSGWLTAAGHEVFLDQDPDAGIAVGDAWEERLHARLRQADAVLCLVSRAYVESAWCAAEVAIARSRGSRLLPVRAEAGVDHPLLPAIQYADLAAEPVNARVHVLGALRRLLVTGRRGWPEERSPFPGLRAFEPDENLAFFGRDRDVERLAAMLRSPVERAKREVLVVVGPSGCGKSSTVRAGLAPMMATEEGWRALPPLVPGTDPEDALAAALTVAAGQAGPDWTLGAVRAALERDGLGRVARELLLSDPAHPRQHLLVVVDQLEQLVTVTPPAERARFAALLAGGLEGQVRVVATLRPEFLAPLLADPALAALRTTIEPLSPLGRDALRLVVEGPAQLWGLTVPEELVARLVDDTGGGAALPLLAFTLARLTEHAGRGATLTVAAYEALGGVEGALQAQADAALGEATAHGGDGDGDLDRDAVLTALLTLVTVDAQGRPTARQRPVEEVADAVVTAFVGRRLLVTATGPDGRPLVGIAHETFLTAWPPLRDAIAAAVTGLRARGTVEAAARVWDEADRPPNRLWQKGQLSAATADVGARIVGPDGRRRPAWLPGRGRTLVTRRVELDGRSREFLHASIRRDRFLRSRLVAVLTTLLVAAGTLAGVAVSRGARLDRELQATTAQLLATAATARGVDDPAFATKMALAAWHADPDGSAARDALARQYLATRSVQRVLQGVTDRPVIDMAALDPAGRTVALLGEQSTITIVTDLLGPAPDAWTVPQTGPRTQLAVSPDGRWLAATAPDGAIDVWDLPARTGPFPLDPGTGPIGQGIDNPLAFSADSGRLLAVRPAAGSLELAMWDVAARARLPVPPGLVDRSVTGVWATPDPALVLVGSTATAIDQHKRLVSRSLRDGSVRHVFATGRADDPVADVVLGGRAVATCDSTPGSSGPPGTRAVLAADTAADLRRIQVSTYCGGELQRTGDGDHLVDPDTGDTDTGYQPARLVDLNTGGAVDTTLPPGRFTPGTPTDPTTVVLTPPDGPPTVLVARGTSILQLRTAPDPLTPQDRLGRTHLSPDGRTVVSVDRGEVTARDAVTGQQQGRLPDPRAGGEGIARVSVADVVLVLTETGDRWRVTTFGLPALDPRETYDVPAGAGVPDVLGDDDHLITVLGGQVVQWDRHTHQQVGAPVTVGDDPDEQSAFRAAEATTRPGRPDQIALVAPDRPVLLLGLAERRVLGRIPVPDATTEAAFDRAGDRLAVLTAQHTLEVWDVDKAVRVREPLFASDVARLLGFTADGYLVASNDKSQIELWDLGRGTLSGALPVPAGLTADTSLGADPLLLTDNGGMPVRLPLTAQTWADQLCAVVGTYTDAERRALPAGTEDRTPCP